MHSINNSNSSKHISIVDVCKYFVEPNDFFKKTISSIYYAGNKNVTKYEWY